MFFYFPLWQGSGTTDELYSGVEYLYENLRDRFEFEIVPEFDTSGSEKKNKILNYDVLLKDLRLFKECLFQKDPDMLFTLGGDCSFCIVTISYLLKKYPGMSIIWIDAHGDLNRPESSPSATLHGMPLRVLIGDGDKSFTDICSTNMPIENLIKVGTRDLDQPEVEYIGENNVCMIDGNNEPSSIIEQALNKSNDKVYLHVDLDVLDPEVFRHVKCLAPGGLTRNTLVDVLRGVTEKREVVGGSVTEYTGSEPEDAKYIGEIMRIMSS
ncbi:arginase family protein [Candidatus Dojkabacteria bacterium]|nr:arginase family protein [Candidatus Dojkabacteria bacterium]